MRCINVKRLISIPLFDNDYKRSWLLHKQVFGYFWFIFKGKILKLTYVVSRNSSYKYVKYIKIDKSLKHNNTSEGVNTMTENSI